MNAVSTTIGNCIESEIYGTPSNNNLNRKVKECGNCKHEISDWERSQHIKHQIRAGVDVEKINDYYCKLDQSGKKCRWLKKSDK